MTSDHAVVLDAAIGEADRIHLEAALGSLTRLGWVSGWQRLPDGRYRVEVDPRAVKEFAALGRPQDHHAPVVGAARLQ